MLRIAALTALVAAFVQLSTGASFAAGFPTKLFLSQDGLAFSSFPSRNVLTKAVRVDRTQGHPAAGWTAVSDQPWLSVTPSGMTGGNLTLKTKTKGLAKDKFYSANVTVSTSGADFTDTETLRVGLWVGSTDPVTVTFQQNATNIATNPVAPVAYVAGNGTSILEYNVYTGALVGTFKKVAPTIGYMEVSSDGTILFAVDAANYKILALDSSSGAVLNRYDIGFPYRSDFNMVYVRPYGMPALYLAGSDSSEFSRTAQRGQIYELGRLIGYPSGETLAGGIVPGLVAATPDGMSVYSVVVGVPTETDLSAYRLTLSRGSLSLKSTASLQIEGSNCTDLAVSRDGKYVFTACGWPYQFDVFDGKSLTQVGALPANPYPDNIEIDQSDRIVGGIDGPIQQYDVYVFDKKGRALGQVATTQQSRDAGQQPGAMKVSGDGRRVISVTYDVYAGPQTLMFRDMP